MRRTRYVALPVRAWQYVGLLVVSLACLTLGLVSRDKEGRAGSLAGPELEHKAPHDVDACPNLTPFTKMPSYWNVDQDQTRTLKTGEARTTRTSLTPADSRISRSRSLDRVSRSGQEMRNDLRSTERSARQRANDFSRRVRDSESRLRTSNQDRIQSRRSFDPSIRLSRSINLDEARLTYRSLERRSRSTEKRQVAFDRRETGDSPRRMTERRERSVRLDDRFDIRDRRSNSLERRETRALDRRENRERTSVDRRDNRFDIRERRSRSIERRTNERREDIREERQERRSLLNRVSNERRNTPENRMDRRIDNRRSTARVTRSYDLPRNNRLNVPENRDVRRVTEERRSSRYPAASRDEDRRSLTRSVNNVREIARSSRDSDKDSRSSSRSLERQSFRVSDDANRRLFKRSVDTDRRREVRNVRSRNVEATRERGSSEQSMERRLSTDSRRERQDRTQRNVDRSRIQLTTRHDFTSNRRNYVRRENSMERREKLNAFDRRLEARSERRESSPVKSLERSRINLERRTTDNERQERLNAFDRRLNTRSERRDSSLIRSLERSRINLERRENRNERRERLNAFDRRLEARESSLIRSFERSRINLERRGRTNRFVREARDARTIRTTESLERDLGERRVRSLPRLARTQESSRRELEQRRTRSLSRMARAPEVSKRELEQRRERNLSNDRRNNERRVLVDSRRSLERSIVSESLNREEVRTDRRTVEQTIDRRDLDSRRSIRQRLNANQMQRAAKDVRSNNRDQRLAEKIRLPLTTRSRILNDERRYRTIAQDTLRYFDKDSRYQSRSVNRNLADSRAFVSHDGTKILGIPGFQKEESFTKLALSFEVLRHTLVIGLCTMYGLSFIHGKSLYSNVISRTQRIFVW